MAMAIAAISLGGFSANAQRNDNNSRTSIEKSDKMYRPQKFTDFAFEGILLDIPQQARIDSLNAAMKAQAPQFNGRKGECTDSVNCTKQNARTDKNMRADRKDRKDNKAGNRQGRNDRRGGKDFRGHRNGGMSPEMKSQYVNKVKEILTPEQYTMFLENIVLMPQQPAQAPQSK